MPGDTYYITTPIYYPDSELHIGHAYTTVAADALARFWRLRGRRVRFLTGTDEHGQKIQRAAEAAGIPPQEFLDRAADRIRRLWDRLAISHDDLIRTTEPRHKRTVAHLFQKIYDQGDIYRADYEGWYCTPCEAFWLERQLADKVCPDCGRPVERVREQSYFFRMSRYADQLLAHIDNNPDFIQPTSRRNEMTSFIRGGLEDLCVSRTTFSWGIPVPFDPAHVIYVWFDALTNYISALGWPDDSGLYRDFWPADVHLMGKEIVRFHAVIWPTILLAAGLPLPKRVFGHGWLVFSGSKISKSRGNIIDPNALVDKYGLDPVRYFLLREVAFGGDGAYSERALAERLNVDLANDLGNLVHRVVTMVGKFSDGQFMVPGPEQEIDAGIRLLAREVVSRVEAHMESLAISDALVEIWRLIGRLNKYVDETAPWALNRQGDRVRLARVLYTLGESLRIIACLLEPFLIDAPAGIWERLGLTDRGLGRSWSETGKWGELPPDTAVRPGPPLYPRVDIDEALGVDTD